jgi:hypothetical protein
MATPALANPVTLSRTVDAIADSVERLERLLPRREDADVLLDFLEDDLREGLDAVGEVEAHFTDVLDALRSNKLSPASLVEAAEDWRVLNRLEYLTVVVSQLRKRLSQAAGQLRTSPVKRPAPPSPFSEE